MQAVLKVFVFSSYLNRKKIGALEPYPTWGDVCGSEISKLSWNNELVSDLVVYQIRRFSTDNYADDKWMFAGKFNTLLNYFSFEIPGIALRRSALNSRKFFQLTTVWPLNKLRSLSQT